MLPYFSDIKTLLPCENAIYIQLASNISSSKKTYREHNCILCCILLQNFLLFALVHQSPTLSFYMLDFGPQVYVDMRKL